MGIYFIAAGSTSKNREKSLDKGFTVEELKPFMPEDEFKKLRFFFDQNEPVYIWGATQNRYRALSKVDAGEYVVDMKNRKAMNVFEYCFYYHTPDTRLQEYIGWDSEKPVEDRRYYRYVFFLRKPLKPQNGRKAYYAKAFDQTDNKHWLIGQRYFSDHEVDMALNRMNFETPEELFGFSPIIPRIEKQPQEPLKAAEEKQSYEKSSDSVTSNKEKKQSFWQWLKALLFGR